MFIELSLELPQRREKLKLKQSTQHYNLYTHNAVMVKLNVQVFIGCQKHASQRTVADKTIGIGEINKTQNT